MSQSQKKWQKEFIRCVFDQKIKNDQFSDVILDNPNLLNSKNEYLPNTLFKFYKATSENILDIKNKRLWLSHPSTFNDPFDCSIGYNEDEYEKKQLLASIKMNGFLGVSGDDVITEDEYNEILYSYVDGKERYERLYSYEDGKEYYSRKKSYSNTIYKILNTKSSDFKYKIYTLIATARDDAKRKISNISEANIRVACFSAAKPHSSWYHYPYNHECLSKIQMWSHYADNHKGFCVEYDISSIRNNIMLNYSMEDYFSNTNKDNYLNERLSVITKDGLFPVIYTNKRINIPYTQLKKYKSDERSDILRILYNAYITKSTVWSYENEWRLIVDEKVSEYYKNKIPFPYIKTIYLGYKMDNNYVNELINIANELDVEVQLMKMDNRKFDLYADQPLLYGLEEERRVYSSPYKK